MGDQVEPADLVEAVNDITGTTLQVSDDAPTLGDKIAQQKQQQLVANQATLMGAQAGAAAGGMGAVRRSTRLRSPRPASRCPVRRRRQAATPARSSPSRCRPSWAARPRRSAPGAHGRRAERGKFSRVTETLITFQEFAMRAMKAMRKRDLGELAWALPIIQTFDPEARAQFDAAVSDLSFIDTSYDPIGLAELATCTMEVMGGHSHAH